MSCKHEWDQGDVVAGCCRKCRRNAERRDLAGQLFRVTAERDRLREALKDIADVIRGGDKISSLEPWARELVTRAKAALDGKGEGEGER